MTDTDPALRARLGVLLEQHGAPEHLLDEVMATLAEAAPLDVERLARVLRYIHGDNVPFPTGRTPDEYAAFIVECDAAIDPEQAETLAVLEAALPHKFAAAEPAPLDVRTLRQRVVEAMPWYDESDPDYSELDAVLRAALAAAEPAPPTDAAVLESAYRIALIQIEKDGETINRLKRALTVATHSPHDQDGEPNEGFPVCSVCGAIQTAEAAPLDAAYRERNAVVAALIRTNGWAAEVVMAPDTEGWFIVYAETPKGQVSWHISPDDMDLFSDWPVAFGSHHSPWDGHTTEEKYRRVAAVTSRVPTVNTTPDPQWSATSREGEEGS